MSAVDDLKNGNQPRRANIDLSSLSGKQQQRRAAMTVADMNEVAPTPKENTPNKTYIESLLDTENPNSDFMKHVREKSEEAREWIEQQEEKRIMEAEAAEDNNDSEDDDDAIDDRGGVVIDITKNTNDEEDEDLTNPDMTESEDLSNAEMISFDLNNEDDKEDEVVGDQSTTEVEEAPPVVEEAPKKELYTADDVNLEVTQEEKSSIDEKSGDDDEDIIDIDKPENADNDEYDRLRAITRERLKPASLNLNLKSFTIAKKAKANVNNIFQAYKAKISKWVLFNQKCTVLMKEFSGSELEMAMEYYRSARRSSDSLRRLYKMVYDHIASPKPSNFETWLKVTPYSDIDNYFFAIYIASFNGANYIPVDCSSATCKKSYITEDINIMDSMVKFESEEKKKEFSKIYKSEVPPMNKGIYTSEIVALSNNVAIGFKEPSLWDIIEMTFIDPETAEEFPGLINLIPYIDNLYTIDIANSTLVPIGYKEYPENSQRTTRSRIKKYNSVFNSLKADEFAPVKGYVSALLEKSSRGVTYMIPETTCPECGHVNPEIEIAEGQVADMVFTRCQLGALVTTSIN